MSDQVFPTFLTVREGRIIYTELRIIEGGFQNTFPFSPSEKEVLRGNVAIRMSSKLLKSSQVCVYDEETDQFRILTEEETEGLSALDIA